MVNAIQKTFLALSVIGILSIAAIDSAFAETACRRDCQAPTIGLLDNGKRIVSDGFTLNSKSYNVDDQSQAIPTQTVKVDKTIKIRLVVNENDGIRNLAHVSLAIGNYPDFMHEDDLASISWDQKFDGTTIVSTSNPNGLLKNVRVSATAADEFNTVFDISFSVTKSLDASSIKTSMWDQNRSDRYNYFTDALAVK